MKWLGFVALLVLLAGSAAAVTSLEAMKFIREENHFLLPNEALEQPVQPIAYADKTYWVIPATAEENVILYFVVPTGEKTLSQDSISSRALISTAQFLREFLNARNQFSQSTANEWIISQNHQRQLESLANVAFNEEFELNIIGTDLNSANGQTLVSAAKRKLQNLQESMAFSSQAIALALQAESDFLSKPSTESPQQIRDAFNAAFDSIQSTENSLDEYILSVNALKQFISTSNHPRAAQLIKQAEIALELPSSIRQLSNNAQAMKAYLDTSYATVSQLTDQFIELVSTRQERSQTYSLLYEPDTEIRQKTGQKISLSEFVGSIQDKSQRPYWKNQEKVASLQDNWDQAEKSFRQENYELARRYAQATKRDALTVYTDGFPQAPKTDNTILFYAAGGLTVLLIGTYLYQNRHKIIQKENP
ncbi:MAG: hypothetical protein HY917_00045 [Candidatus Diapherotrites archaeon]|nr:hypothetical protein [Candidatus Diapherotrites archaeon]